MSSISCSTCLECFFPSSDVSTTPCGHLFHTKCIKKWFQANDKKTCPHCRTDVKSNEIRKVYFSAAEPGDEKEENVGVSVQGVKSLWGDCMFIPEDWGS